MTTEAALTLEQFAREHLGPGASIDADPTARRPFSRFNIVGSFSDVEVSRRALRTEEDEGTRAENISLLVIGGEPVANPDRPLQAVGPDPEGVAGDTFRRVVPGMVIGGAIGAVLVLIGALVFGSLSGAELLGVAVAGALMLSAVGGVVGAFWGFGDSDAFRHTFTDLHDGIALVAVHTDDADEASVVRARLGDAGARVWVLDPKGRPVRSRASIGAD